MPGRPVRDGTHRLIEGDTQRRPGFDRQPSRGDVGDGRVDRQVLGRGRAERPMPSQPGRRTTAVTRRRSPAATGERGVSRSWWIARGTTLPALSRACALTRLPANGSSLTRARALGSARQRRPGIERADSDHRHDREQRHQPQQHSPSPRPRRWRLIPSHRLERHAPRIRGCSWRLRNFPPRPQIRPPCPCNRRAGPG